MFYMSSSFQSFLSYDYMTYQGCIFLLLQSDASLDGYKKHIVAKNAEAPLTESEMELREMERNEV